MANPIILKRRLMRVLEEASYINTIAPPDLVHIDFVWYPGASNAPDSYVQVLGLVAEAPIKDRFVEYTWARAGKAPVRRKMTVGRISLPLPPGTTGTLTVFDTSWQITRTAVGVAMSPSAGVLGIQQRLNILGYHLRTPGLQSAGVDGVAGRHTENAVIAFQADYQPAPGAAAAVANRLVIRGEWMNNPGIAFNLNWYNQVGGGPANINPSGTDSANMQAALVAAVGA